VESNFSAVSLIIAIVSGLLRLDFVSIVDCDGGGGGGEVLDGIFLTGEMTGRFSFGLLPDGDDIFVVFIFLSLIGKFFVAVATFCLIFFSTLAVAFLTLDYIVCLIDLSFFDFLIFLSSFVVESI
jgi:hypothetical protein